MNFLIINLLNDGGPTFTYPMLIMFLIVIALIIKAFLKGDAEGKTKKLISHISLFALVWGFLGQLIGLIGAFDSIQAAGDVAPSVLAAGLKIALLSPTFGMVIFLVGRAGIILLSVLKK
ncbi:MotA/TolQ/ExbB proton channel family protein [Lutibacter aestuarii]|uniref:MotA/TolQ/ExbB proton channel family protein n=1 Tax=Lutibacter aestuarii TaxID=861111 RepID=A0ABW2Z8N0_9FLAO|nr:MotA/TolQ/ExbB proton channel family protein [uncultured Lutibacter sp.]